MTYIPISPKERDAMLETIGVKKLADLFEAVPAEHRFPNLDLPPAITEMEAAAELGIAQAPGASPVATCSASVGNGAGSASLESCAEEEHDRMGDGPTRYA